MTKWGQKYLHPWLIQQLVSSPIHQILTMIEK